MKTDWVMDEILTGLQKLVCLGLDRQPAGELLQLTAGTWHEVITHNRVFNQAQDQPRFRDAFATLMGECTQWPTPRQFLDCLPAPIQEKQPPLLTSEESRDRVLGMLDDFKQRMGWDHEDSEEEVQGPGGEA